MNQQNIIFLLIMLFSMSCRNTSGQEVIGGDVEFIGETNILFYEAGLKDTINVSGVVRVSFTDSTSLDPKSTDITILRMKGEDINFSYFYSKENNLDDYENKLMEKYTTKVDSIFMNGEYQFYGEKKWILGNRLDFSYVFKIAPK